MAVHGSKTTLAYGNASTVAGSTVWTPIAAIDDIKPPKVEADDIETSHMQTPNEVKTFDPGWAEAGEVECSIQFEKAQNAALYGLFRTPKGWRMQFNDLPAPSGSKWEFDGYIKSFANEVDREQLVTADIVIKIAGGLPTFTAGA